VANIFGGSITQATETAYCVGADNSGTVNIISGSFSGGAGVLENVLDYPEGESALVLVPEMLNGASVRLVQGSNGIRFTSTVTKTYLDYLESIGVTDITYGTIISPYDYVVLANDFTPEMLDVANIPGITVLDRRYEIVQVNEGFAVDDEGNITFNAALVNIKSENIDREFAARAYIAFSIGGQEYKIYSAFSTGNVRSMEFVAYMALADVTETADEEYVNEVDSYYVFNTETGLFILVNQTAYSPYTDADIAVLKSYMKGD
jgi:hypothetical protein